MTTPAQWEYMHNEHHSPPTETFLDKLGAQGWELVSVVHREYGGQTFGKSAWHSFLKRAVQPAAKAEKA